MTNRPGHLLPALGGLSEPDNDVEPSLRGTALAGLVTIVACFGGFAGWSLLADLDSAVIASDSPWSTATARPYSIWKAAFSTNS